MSQEETYMHRERQSGPSQPTPLLGSRNEAYLDQALSPWLLTEILAHAPRSHLQDTAFTLPTLQPSKCFSVGPDGSGLGCPPPLHRALPSLAVDQALVSLSHLTPSHPAEGLSWIEDSRCSVKAEYGTLINTSLWSSNVGGASLTTWVV